MDRRSLIFGGAGLLSALFVAGPAAARVLVQTPVADEAAIAEEVKRGGRGRGGGGWGGRRGRGWAASRGRKRGWYIGRGNAWGRRRRHYRRYYRW